MIGKKLLLRELIKLEENGIITGEISERIRMYYLSSEKKKTVLLLIIFGILGSLLIGSGIILLLAHNWDDLPRWVRTIISIVPLIAAQYLCGYAIIKKNDSHAWRESTAVFLFFAVGASISLISQTYNIYGDFGRFILVWSILMLPIVYLLDTVAVSIFYLGWICIWTGYQADEHVYPWLYWPLVGAIIPFGYQLKNTANSIRFTLFSWAAVLFATVTLSMLFMNVQFIDYLIILPLAYMLFFLLLYLIGQTRYYDTKHFFANPASAFGSGGVITLLLILSFDDIWNYYQKHHLLKIIFWDDTVRVATLIGMCVAIFVLFWRLMKSGKKHVAFYTSSLIALGIGYSIMWVKDIPILLIQLAFNAILLLIGVSTIVQGVKQDNLATTNFGMLIISALVLCRFLDSNLSFIIRGIAFIAIGIGFLAANYFLMRKNKNET